MQVYVLYMSTFHVFHGMPPMCELCAAVKSYQNGLVSEPDVALHNFSFDIVQQYLPEIILFVVNPLYQSRAPPQRSHHK